MGSENMTSNIDSIEIKVEGDSISPQKQPEIPPPQNITDADSSPENTVSNSEHKITSGLCCLIHVGRFLFKICLILVVSALVGVVAVFILPLLFVAFVVVRLFQFIVGSKNLKKLLLIKNYLCVFITVLVIGILLEIGLFSLIVKYVPWVTRIMIIGLPITKWINIICILMGIFLLSQIISFSLVVIIARLISDKPEMKLILSQTMSEIVGCLLLLLAEIVVMDSVPTFNQSKICGIYSHNWIKVTLFLIIGYNIITLVTHALVWLLLKFYGDNGGDPRSDTELISCWGNDVRKDFNKKYIVYIATCIKRCIISILSMVMLLITWVVYFVSRLDETPKDTNKLEFGTWTIVSVLVCLFLWLIKSCILLYWEAHAMYVRLHPKIRDIGMNLYFLIMLSYTHYCTTVDGVESRESVTEDDLDCEPPCCGTQPKSTALWVLLVNNNENEKNLLLNRKSVRAELIDYPRSSIYDLQRAAQRLLTAQYALSKESTLGDVDHLQGGDDSRVNENCREALRMVVPVEDEAYFEEDWEMLLKLLPEVHTTEDITLDKVKTFMERAHSRCIFLADTLISENEVVKCLNQVISWLIMVVTIITWLLLTGLASTKVLVLIASPLLAATFIFGDTAKSLFQGLIFVYVVHPFDVGDLCIIDDKLLEVKRIGIWSTTFSKVRTLGKQQQVIYPNSVLAQKNVINHKTNFDWDDNIEFLCSPEANITEPLKHKIERYLDDTKDKFTPKFRSVEILEMGEKAKIAVHVKHKFKTTEGWTYFECLKKKEKRRFKLAIHVQKLLKRVESEANTSEMEDFLTRG